MGDTKDGIKFMGYGFLVIAIMSLVYILSSGLMSSHPQNYTQMTCFAGLLALVTIIFFLVGTYKIYSGKNWFSDKHQTFVKIAIALLIVGFIAQMGSNVVSNSRNTELSENIDHFKENEDEAKEFIRTTMLQVGLISLVGTICYALYAVLLIIELAPDKTKKFLYGGAGANITLSVAVVAASWMILSGDMGVLDSLYKLIQMSQLMAGLNIVGYLLFYYAYTDTRNTLSWRSMKESIEEERTREEDSGLGGPSFGLETCPECGQKALETYIDGSGSCRNCGYTTSDYREEEG